MTEYYREQHKRRLSYMPWLYHSLKPQHRSWVDEWQSEIQTTLCNLETVTIGKNCFISPDAHIFAEPGRPVIIGDHCLIAADTFIHGPVTLGNHVSINHGVSMDGGAKGIIIGNCCRIASRSTLFAFNHGMDPDRPVMSQAVFSQGITLGEDVWIGANCGITDGVNIGNGAVVGMGSVVTRDVAPMTKVGGNPAQIIGER